MKIPTIEQIRRCETYTMTHKPIASIDLMEVAANRCANSVKQQFSIDVSIAVFCGMGNNGGDGLALTRILHRSGYNCKAFIIKHKTDYSAECLHQLHLLENLKIDAVAVENENEIPQLHSFDLIVDALIGIGLAKPIEHKLLVAVIERINKSNACIFAIDTPSGLLFEATMKKEYPAIHAHFTLSFQFPKLSFFFAENEQYVGKWEIADIGLDKEYIHRLETQGYCVDTDFMKSLFRTRKKFAHKGDFGHGLLMAGSLGMMGAAVLASQAAMRAGIGLLTVSVPKTGVNIMQTAVPEALCRLDENENYFTGFDTEMLSKYSAIAIGCGLGTNNKSADGLQKLMTHFKGNMIFDADAINILAANKTWLNLLSPNAIFTPHIKEFERLTQKTAHSYERLELQRNFSKLYQCVVVLKGAHTCISTPTGELFFNTTGNQGMATAGSGDVLTGILLGLLSQGYAPVEAALLGVFLHGLAGDCALDTQSQESMIASDIIENIGKAFNIVRA